jgi:hypothetical protein
MPKKPTASQTWIALVGAEGEGGHVFEVFKRPLYWQQLTMRRTARNASAITARSPSVGFISWRSATLSRR